MSSASKRYSESTNDVSVLSKILQSINRSNFYNFNDYEFVSPKNSVLVRDPKCRDIYPKGYRKRKYRDKPIRSIINYDAFYPENFHYSWEVIKKFELVRNDDFRFATIDDGTRPHFYPCSPLGHLEALIKYCENYTRYELNEYIRIPLDRLKSYRADIKFREVYHHVSHEFSKDAYTPDVISPITMYYSDKKFDFVFGYSLNFFRNIISVLILSKGKSCILYIPNMFEAKCYGAISYLSKLFENVSLYKSICANPLDPSCFLVLKNYRTKGSISKLVKMVESESCEYAITKRIGSSIRRLKFGFRENYRRFLETLIKDKDLTLQNCMNPNKYSYKRERELEKNAIEWANENDLEVKEIYTGTGNILNNDHKYKSYKFDKYNLDKKLKFNKEGDYRLSVDELHAIKRKLNRIKRLIDTKEQFVFNDLDQDIVDWNKLTDCIDVYRNLKKVLSWKYNTEMTTNAWMKFYEIVSSENLFNKRKKSIKCFHVCEAPGAFISSMNHFVNTQTEVSNYDWYAQSLNPFKDKSLNSSVLQDKFGLMIDYKDRWLFGSRGSGDVTELATINSYSEDPKLKDIDLITGDVGLRTPTNKFNEQESYVGRVNFGQVLTILTVLPVSRNAVFKSFLPFSETFTVSLVYLLVSVFNTVKVVKPLTSHPSSSEVYLVCKEYLGFKSIPSTIQDRLFFLLEYFDINTSIFPRDFISDDFIKELVNFSQSFCSNQIKSIKRSLYLRDVYFQDIGIQEDMTKERDNRVDSWIKEYNLKRLPNDKRLKNKFSILRK